MHTSCYEWVRSVVANYGLDGRSVIEIGSQNVNGSVRDHFPNSRYVGVDLAKGNGVDRVGNSEDLEDPDATWEVCISCEMLEHCARPWRAVNEMARITQKSGHVILSMRGYDSRGCWGVHSYPHDYWRVSEDAMRILAEDAGLEVLECIPDSEGPGVFLHAVKP